MLIALAAACAGLVAIAAGLAHHARERVAKSARVAWAFAIPGLVLAVAAIVCAITGATAAAIGLAAASAMFLLAAATFVPTEHTRFAEFERRFWAHVAHLHRERSHQ